MEQPAQRLAPVLINGLAVLMQCQPVRLMQPVLQVFRCFVFDLWPGFIRVGEVAWYIF